MEKMKRAISFIMALVLILGMVPGTALTAGAEEVETEPAVVETTEAPAETEAPVETEPAETEAETAPEETETVPEETETVPEETEPATIPEETVLETVPEETESETVPEETEAETVPKETVTETVPEETETVIEEAVPADKVSAGNEAAGATADPTGITVKASTKRTYVGDKVKLTASIEPAKAVQTAFEWELIDEKGIANLSESGVLTATAPGTVEVRAVSTKDDSIVSKAVEVTFVDCRIAFNLAPIDEDYLLDLNDDDVMDAIRIRPGVSLEVTLKYQTNETGNEEDWVTEYLLEPDVEWKMPSSSTAYASYTVDSDSENIITLKGKTVTETKSFTLSATDAIAGKAEVEVLVCPNPVGLEICRSTGTNVGGKTITIDLGKYDREEYRFPLYASVVPADSAQKIKWKTSSAMVADVEVVEKSGGTEVMVIVGGERLEGKATLTAICKEDSSIRETVTIKTVDYLQQDELCWHSTSKAVTDLVAGKSVKLKALDKTDPENKKVLTSEKVAWSIRSEDKAYATITQEGVLTARDVASGKEIMVYCRVIGNEEACLQLPVVIRPKATYVRLLDENGKVCSNKTLHVNTVSGEVEAFTLGHLVAPQDDGADMGALQTVTWKSSNTAIAKVGSKSGKITWQGKNGTVTITATAADGSGKSASTKIKFSKFAESVTVSCPLDYVRSGESVTMRKTIAPSSASSAKLTWSLADGDEKYASISSSGKLKVKTIYEQRYITVNAVAEGSKAKGSVQVLVKPAKDKILTLMSGDTCVTKTTQQLDKSTETIELTAYIVGKDTPEEVTWKYSSIVKKVSDDGAGTAVFEMKNTGTATITATAKSSGKTASITVKGIRKTARIDIKESSDKDLTAGQSMTMKAKLYDDEGKAPTRNSVKWSLAGNGKSYASISSSGKLTAKSSYRGDAVSVTVVAKATDGSGVEDTCQITIRPKATGVEIQRDGVTYISMTHSLDSPDKEKFRLKALVYPLDQADNAVTWTSSNKKIATVSTAGLVTCKGTGTVTIKATAKDGSGKYATIKLTIKKPVYEISFSGNKRMVAGGKTLTLTPKVLAVDGTKPTNSAVSWKIEGDTSYVTFSKGVLKCKTVTERKYVTVTAKAKDGSGVSASWDVIICPATTSVQILDENGSRVTQTQYMRVGDTLDLGAISYPNKDNALAAQSWSWKSSSKTYATVNSYGVVTAKKAGTVTIQATVKDGTGKYDTIKIKILK